jgi:hypothetical protein
MAQGREIIVDPPVDMVNHPPHYGDGPPCPNCGHPIECIVITRRLGFNVGNAIKYLWRAGKKGDLRKHVQDLRKAAWYCNDEADDIEKREGLA